MVRAGICAGGCEFCVGRLCFSEISGLGLEGMVLAICTFQEVERYSGERISYWVSDIDKQVERERKRERTLSTK